MKEIRVTLEKILEEAENLPVIPTILIELLKQLENPKSSAKDLQKVIEKDQSLTAKVLKIANSAYYGYPRNISAISEAVVVLGFNTIHSLALAMLTRQLISTSAIGYGFKKGQLWKHSLATALLAKYISQRLKLVEYTEKIFTGGLLHDIGKLLLDSYVRKIKNQILSDALLGDMELIEAEEKRLGLNHAVVGAELAKKWNFPDFLEEMIRYHHTPEEAPENSRNLVTIIFCANNISYAIVESSLREIGLANKKFKQGFQKALELGLSKEDINKLIENVRNELEVIENG